MTINIEAIHWGSYSSDNGMLLVHSQSTETEQKFSHSQILPVRPQTKAQIFAAVKKGIKTVKDFNHTDLKNGAK